MAVVQTFCKKYKIKNLWPKFAISKTMKVLLILFLAAAYSADLFSIGVTKEQLVIRESVVYETNSEKPFTGNYESFHKNGGLRLRETYKNGQLIERNNYKNGKFHGPREGYLQNGQLEWLENYKDGKYHGLQEYFYKNSQIRWRGSYDNGKKIGMAQTFRPNGQVLIAEYYSENKSAVYQYFDQNNQIITSGVLEYYFEIL